MSASKRSEKGIPEPHPFVEAFGLDDTMNLMGWDQNRQAAWAEQMIETCGIAHLINGLGIRPIIETIGVERVVEVIGLANLMRCSVHEYGIDGFVALLSEELRQRFKELLV
jgi:hypothetical protein